MTKTHISRKAFYVLCATLLAALCVTILVATPSTARADETTDENELYDPVVVVVEDDPTVVDPQENVTYEKASDNYQVILTGVTDANKDTLADAVLENVENDEPVKFVNQNFVDAEKYSVTCESYDKYHCWLGSTSNILTLTGWAQNYINPLTGTPFANEDEVLAFMTSSFQDQACEPTLAYAYFFDGLFGGTYHDWIRTSEATDNKPFSGTSHTGFDTQVGYANIAKRVECDSSLSGLSVLEELQDYALEMSISGATSHSVTIMGVVIDTSKQGAERYVAILIADTDNDPYNLSEAPTTFATANEIKSSRTNSYTMYHISLGKVSNQTVALINKYMKYKNDAYISSFTQVSYYSDTAREAALETASNATCNAKTTGDIALSGIEVIDNDYETKSVYTTADQLQLLVVIMNMNADVDFSTATTGHEYLANRIDVYRDGVYVGAIEDDAKVSLAEGISCTRGTRMFIDLSKYDFLKEPGTYTLKFYLNTDNIDEAYISNNNSPQSYTFTIKADQDESDNADINNDQSISANDTSSSVNSSSVGSATPKTGDPFGIAAILVALIAALACSFMLAAARKQ